MKSKNMGSNYNAYLKKLWINYVFFNLYIFNWLSLLLHSQILMWGLGGFKHKRSDWHLVTRSQVCGRELASRIWSTKKKTISWDIPINPCPSCRSVNPTVLAYFTNRVYRVSTVTNNTKKKTSTKTKNTHTHTSHTHLANWPWNQNLKGLFFLLNTM